MYTFLLIVQVVICVVLVSLVLVQKGQGADIGAVFGGGGSQTVFGARGAGNFLSHITAVVAALFFLNSLGLAYLSDSHGRAVNAGIVLPSATKPAPVSAPVVSAVDSAAVPKTVAAGHVAAATAPTSSPVAAGAPASTTQSHSSGKP